MRTVKFCGVELEIDPELKIRFLTCNPNGAIKGWSHKPTYYNTLRGYLYDHPTDGSYRKNINVIHFNEKPSSLFQNRVAYPEGIIEELFNTIEAWDLTLDLKLDSKFLTMDSDGAIHEWNCEPIYKEVFMYWGFNNAKKTESINYLETHIDSDSYGPAKDRIIGD